MQTDVTTVRQSLPRLTYTVREVAEMTGKSESWVRRLLRDRVLQSHKVGGSVLIPRSALKRIDTLNCD
jgi:excisionase family DNA binding protein